MKTRISAHAVSRSTIEDGNIQTKYGDFITEAIDVQPYGFLHCVPDNAMSVVCRMEGDSAQRYALINYLPQVPYGLEAEEVALYSNHGQVLYCREDGTLHLEAAGKISLHSDEEDLYSLLKDIIGVIKGLTTDKIDTKVNGGSVALAPSGTSPVAGAEGKNPGVGLSADSGDKLDKIVERLDKLLQKGEKPQSVEQQQQKKYEAQKKALEDAQSGGDAKDNTHLAALINPITGKPIKWKPMETKTSTEAKALIKDYEKLSLEPYDSKDGHVTIGYGQVLDDDGPDSSGQTIRELQRRNNTYKYPWYNNYKGIYDRCFELKKAGKSVAEIVEILKNENLAIDKALAEQLFEANIEYLEKGLQTEFEGGNPDSAYAKSQGKPDMYAKGRHLAQEEFDAVIMFGFNVGRSGMTRASFFQTLQQHISFEEEAVKQEIISKWQSYNKSGGKFNPGLNRRRNDELQMFFYADYSRNYNDFFMPPVNDDTGIA